MGNRFHCYPPSPGRSAATLSRLRARGTRHPASSAVPRVSFPLPFLSISLCLHASLTSSASPWLRVSPARTAVIHN
jgi:hypothetical protein